MLSEVSVILTTIALNLLKKVGVHNSLVFSPYSIWLSLFVQRDLEHNAIFHGVPRASFFQLGEYVNVFGVNKIESFSLKTKHPLNVNLIRRFQVDENHSKHFTFAMMNAEENRHFSCEENGARMAKDEYFDVLELPLAQKKLHFVAFIPNNELPLSKNLKKLDTTRFHKLLRKLSHEFIHFEIPLFQLNTHYSDSELFGKASLDHHHHNFTFTIGDNRATTRRLKFVEHPCGTDPYPIKLNRPFVFSVLNGTTPMLMGVFNGI